MPDDDPAGPVPVLDVKVVIIGAGIVGCAVADELAHRGVRDIVLLDQGPWPRPGGSTSHAPGNVFQTNASDTMGRFATYTLDRLDHLTTPEGPCAVRVGSLEVATTPDRLEELGRRCGWAQGRGLTEARVLGPDEAARLHSLLEPGRILGALHVPTDAWVRPHQTAATLARRSGATLVSATEVTGIETVGRAVRAVTTDRGRFPADVVVCCAGIWGPRVGRLAGVRIPLQPMAHQYAVTGAVDALGPSSSGGAEVRQPILRHQGAGLYFREHGDRFGVGSYSHRPMPIDPDALGDGSVDMPSVLPFTPEDFASSWADAVDLLPALARTTVEEGMNGVFSFTPDGAPILGPVAGLDGFWVAEAIWITQALGAARAVAEGICGQPPTFDLHEMDPSRFEPPMTTPASVRPAAVARFVEVYDAVHPLRPPAEQRPLRASPFFHREVELGAAMLVGNGWERPQWYAVNEALGRPVGRAWTERRGWAARHWSPIVGAEHLAGRAGAGLWDMTSLRRLEVRGPGALGLLEHLTTTRMDKPPGSVGYTLMLDEHGGIRSDVTVARLDEDRFWIGTNGPQDEAWLTTNARGGPLVEVRDLTGSVCCLGLWGPSATAIMGPLADVDLGFGYFTHRAMHVGDVPVRALRVSYVGEHGWELYTTADYGQRLWDLLWRDGAAHGLIAAGRGSLESMRMEKGYRAWGRDMTSVDSPEEAGLEWAVDRKLDFLGRAALDWRPADRRLRTVTLDDPADVVLGGETVWVGDRVAGTVTSAAYGYSIGRGVAYAWLPVGDATVGAQVEIGWFGRRLAATVTEDALWDAGGSRVRAR